MHVNAITMSLLDIFHHACVSAVFFQMITIHQDPKGTSVFMKRSSDPTNGQSSAVASVYDIDDVDSLKFKIEDLERRISQYEVFQISSIYIISVILFMYVCMYSAAFGPSCPS